MPQRSPPARRRRVVVRVAPIDTGMPRVRAQTMARVSVTEYQPGTRTTSGFVASSAAPMLFDVERRDTDRCRSCRLADSRVPASTLAVEERRVPLEGAIEPCALLLGTRPRRIQHRQRRFPDSSPPDSGTTAPDTALDVSARSSDGSASCRRSAPTLPPAAARAHRQTSARGRNGPWLRRVARVGGECGELSRRSRSPDPDTAVVESHQTNGRRAPARRSSSEALLAWCISARIGRSATRAGNTLLGV